MIRLARSLADPPSYFESSALRAKAHVTDFLEEGVAREIDHEALTDYLLNWGSWGDLFRNIRLLSAGTAVEQNGASRRVSRDTPNPFSETWLEEPVATLAEKLRALLVEAAAWAVGDARTIGILVGGTDSCGALAALAQVLPPERIRAMTITGEPGDGDTDPDVHYVSDLCQHLGVRLLQHRWSPTSSPIEGSLIVDSRPAYTAYMTKERAWLRQLVDSGVEVVLGAHAGDSVFGGELDELAHRLPRRPLQSIRTALASVPWNVSPRVRAHWLVAAPVSRVWARQPRVPQHYGPRLRSAFPRRLLRRLAPTTPRARIEHWYRAPCIVSAALYNHALTRGFGVLYRDVALYPPLVRFLASVPVEKLNCDARFRGLYHRAISPWVSHRVAERRTKSFHDPFARAPEKTVRVLRDLASGRELERIGFVDGRQLQAAFDRGARDALWNFLTAEAWLREVA